MIRWLEGAAGNVASLRRPNWRYLSVQLYKLNTPQGAAVGPVGNVSISEGVPPPVVIGLMRRMASAAGQAAILLRPGLEGKSGSEGLAASARASTRIKSLPVCYPR